MAASVRERPAAILLVLVVLLAACGGATGTASPSLSASTGPSASVDTGKPAPSPTLWPGGVIEAVMNLGKADAEIQAAGADLGAAAAYQDLEAMWGAADGLATLISRLEGQIPRIVDYPETAAAAEAYAAALPDMLAGARTLRDSIKAGDAAGVQAGSRQLAQGLESYAVARRLIGPLVDQALLMQKLLLK
jgi:hypothetical protein